MQKITTFLTYNDQAEEAVNIYVSLFKNAEITHISRYPDDIPELAHVAGQAMTISFTIEGQEFIALNGGPQFKFDQGISLMINCETQEEIDRIWDKLMEGGEAQACGWLKDKFGVSWQVTPTILGDMMNDTDKERAGRVMKAMMQMVKFDIATLEAARDQV
ncbi:MAG: VOC family protein [Fimbriimonadaceae bacterium]|nr:VOC family protein [Fimbriimonadaceae bacterium]